MRLIVIRFKKRKFTNLKKTEQENFWMGNFGDEYIKRNLGEESSEGRDYNYVNQFAKIFLNNRIEIYSSIEVGANIGINSNYQDMANYAIFALIHLDNK